MVTCGRKVTIGPAAKPSMTPPCLRTDLVTRHGQAVALVAAQGHHNEVLLARGCIGGRGRLHNVSGVAHADSAHQKRIVLLRCW